MTNEKPRLFPIFLILVLAAATIAATIVLPNLFGDPSARPETWNASIIIACVLEALIYLYAALPFFPGVRGAMSMTVYPSIAFVLVPYALAAILTIFLAASSTALYATLLSGETIVALGIVGILSVVGNTRRRGEASEAVDRATAYKPAAAARAARDELASVKGKGSDAAFKACADALRRLEERSSSATRFGRPSSEAAEAEIASSIGSLAGRVAGLGGLGPEGIDAALEACAAEALSIVKALDRRERGLVK
jgi:hypothetical protein